MPILKVQLKDGTEAIYEIDKYEMNRDIEIIRDNPFTNNQTFLPGNVTITATVSEKPPLQTPPVNNGRSRFEILKNRY